MSLFTSYRIIEAEKIIRANIRPDHISDDATELISTLAILTCILKNDRKNVSNLHSNVIKKLDSKKHTLDLLKPFGYVRDSSGNYGYQPPNSIDESTRRENAVNEFRKFNEDLVKIRNGTFDMLNVFLRSARASTSSMCTHTRIDDDSDVKSQTKSFPNSRSESPRMPRAAEVKNLNNNTLQTIRSFKESIVPQHSQRVAHSFIRRKLLILLYKQKHADWAEFGEDIVDGEVDELINELRRSDQQSTTQGSNEIYIECLIRADLNLVQARQMLRNNRPNLMPPQVPVAPRNSNTTDLSNSIASLRRCDQLLNEDANNNGAPQVLLHEGDEWRNTAHIVRAITRLRQQSNNGKAEEGIVSKMHRMLFAELSHVIGQQIELKIELLSYILCELDRDSLEYLSIDDLKGVLCSGRSTELTEDFEENARRLLAVNCPICGGSYPRSRIEMMYLCDHMCCLDCAKAYYTVTIKEISEPGTLKKLTCFQEPVGITDDVMLDFFQYLGSKFNQWFNDQRLLLETYHENLFLATRGSQIKRCGNPRCVSFFDVNNNQRIGRAQCPHCQFQQCQLCCRKWLDIHEGRTCEEYAEWLVENDPDDPEVQLNKYLKTAGMECPNQNCTEIYEYRAGGCEHFTCPACKTEFCRICSALFYKPGKSVTCPRPNCTLKNTIHAHCCLNCYREIRDASIGEITEALTSHNIDVETERRLKPEATGNKCPTDGCINAPSMDYENRFCETCYKEFLCLLIWRNKIEPWSLYQDNQLRQKLIGASVNVTENASKEELIELSRQHLTKYLGQPKTLRRVRQQQ